MDMVKYTFLLPAYKPDFFEEALRSIKTQTYTNFKVLVSDDCSPHDLKSIFDKVCGDDERFAYRRNEQNMGGKSLVAHWNLLVDMCDTEYFILASDDDIYAPTFLEEVDKLTIKYPEVDLIRGRCKMFNEKGNIEFYDGIFPEYTNHLEFIYLMYLPNSIKCMANYVFKLSTFKEDGGFVNFPLAWFSDTATAIKYGTHGVANTPDVLFSFRVSNVNISFSKNDDKKACLKAYAARAYFKWFDDLIKPFEENSENLDAWQRGMLSLIEDRHRELVKNELLKYLPNMSFRHLFEYLPSIDERLYRVYCFLVYIKTKVKRIK